MIRIYSVLLTALFLSACAKLAPVPESVSYLEEIIQSKAFQLQACQTLVAKVESTIIAADVVDSQAARIPDFPYLRVSRFLASFRYEVSGQAFALWLDLLSLLAHSGWRFEIANLPDQNKEQPSGIADKRLLHRLQNCSKLFKQRFLDDKNLENLLKDQASVPSEYQTLKRIIGFYPLTALVFRLGIYQWHQETLVDYATPLPDLPLTGKLTRYAAPLPNKKITGFREIGGIITRSSDNELNIPLLLKAEQQQLFEFFAPVFEVDVASPDDHIGTPVLREDGFAAIESDKPVVFQHVSYTRLKDQVLLQLNYTIWFPARTKISVFDLLGGHLDGLTWRITLLPNGKPLIFDTIHNCGCYHLFFPTQFAKAINNREIWEEPAFLPQKSLNFDQQKQLVIRIAAKTHYVERVYLSDKKTGNEIQYHWRMADTLRSLPLPGGGFRSLYGPDGIIAGTERGERWFFWPMGIPDPGAMRQWGHHATAFVGFRHFDDARLFENSFEILGENGW